MHLLVIRFSSLGDVILASSLPAQIKQRWGMRVHLSFLTSTAFAPLLTGVSWIDQLSTIDRGQGMAGVRELFQKIRQIRQEREIDLIIDMHATLRSLLIRFRFWDLPRIFVDKRSPERWLLTLAKWDLLSAQADPGKRRQKGFGQLLLERNVTDFSGLFELERPANFPWSSCAVAAAKAPWDRARWGIAETSSYICFAPSASFPEKRWPASSFFALIERLCLMPQYHHYQFVILAGGEDQFCRIFDPLTVRFPGRVLNLQGKSTLLESAQIVGAADCCVGNDTGLPHIAESLGTPVVAILGPTGEEFGYYPHLPSSVAVMKKLWCRPCTTNGKGNCIRSERFCLTEISVDDVVAALATLPRRVS